MMQRKHFVKFIGKFFYNVVLTNYSFILREAREVLNVLQNNRGDARLKAQQIISKIPSNLAQELNSNSSRPNFGA